MAGNGRRLAEADRLCRRVTRRAGPNFSLGFRLLPREKRRAVHASYAFCRFVDDEVDEATSGDVAGALDAWETELARVYAGRPERPVGVALASSLERFPIPRIAFADLIAGCRLDLSRTRYADVAELLHYCRLVAGTISTISLSIFGFDDRDAVERGYHLSLALQFTNMLRDVGEDLRQRARIYLPADEMESFGVGEDALRAGRRTDGFLALMRFQTERARAAYRRAEPLLGQIHEDARHCVWLMGRVYLDILGRIEASGFAVFGPRIGLSRPAKAALLARGLILRPARW